MDSMLGRSANDQAAGVPATPGSAQFVYDAAFRQWRRVKFEQDAIWRHISKWPLMCLLSCKRTRSEPAPIGACVPAWACPFTLHAPLPMIPPLMLQMTRRSTPCPTRPLAPSTCARWRRRCMVRGVGRGLRACGCRMQLAWAVLCRLRGECCSWPRGRSHFLPVPLLALQRRLPRQPLPRRRPQRQQLCQRRPRPLPLPVGSSPTPQQAAPPGREINKAAAAAAARRLLPTAARRAARQRRCWRPALCVWRRRCASGRAMAG